jgi:hypothetical protein
VTVHLIANLTALEFSTIEKAIKCTVTELKHSPPICRADRF